MDPPTHPDTNDPGDRSGPAAAMGWGARIAIGVVVAMVVLVILLHLTGIIGPAAH